MSDHHGCVTEFGPQIDNIDCHCHIIRWMDFRIYTTIHELIVTVRSYWLDFRI